MKVLIVKMSSLGDVIHTLPALTDAGKQIPSLIFDWLVEENFSEIPKWHPLVRKVIPVAIRRWRKKPFKFLLNREIYQSLKILRQETYDYVIDAQGLIKSAILTKFSKGNRIGLDKQSLTESLARFAYQRHVKVDLQDHAVSRMRQIFAQALDYQFDSRELDYGLSREQFNQDGWKDGRYVVFLHGTTWPTKHWIDTYWVELAERIAKLDYRIRVPWNNDEEYQRVKTLEKSCSAVSIIPKTDLKGIACVLANAKAVVAVDTGLGHLAAALSVPTVSLYGPTNPERIGTIGEKQIHLMANINCRGCLHSHCPQSEHTENHMSCIKKIKPTQVFSSIADLL